MGHMQRLDALMNDCRDMFRARLADLAGGDLSELASWPAACAEMRLLLVQALDTVDTQEMQRDDADRVRAMLSELTDLNEKLYHDAALRRQAVAERLSCMRKGKSALSGYRLVPQQRGPRFLSSNG